MALHLVTAPADEPYSLADAKAQIAVDFSDADDLIRSYITAAREYVEAFTRRKLITQTWDLKLDAFPCGDAPIVLPFPPVSSVTSVTYVDTAGTTQTWTSGATGYTTDLPSGPQASLATIYPSYGISYPVTRSQPNAVTVRFVCGYGSGPDSVPRAFFNAIGLLVGTRWAHRESTVLATMPKQLEQGVEFELWPYRVWA